MREPAGGSSPRRYFPVSQPPASGLNGVYPTPCSWQSGKTVSRSPCSRSENAFCTHSYRVRPFERGQLERLGELLGREVRGTRGADRAGADELVERLERLLLRDVRVEGVREVERDPVDAEPAEARLDLPPDPGAARAPGRPPRSSG